MNFNSDDRRWLGDLVSRMVESAFRLHPEPQLKPGKVIVNDPSSVKSIAVELDDQHSVIYPDNITGQPLLLNERVMVLQTGSGSFIVGRWTAPWVPHTSVQKTTPAGSRSTNSVTPTVWNGTENVQVTDFVKYRPETALIFRVECSAYHDTVGGQIFLTVGAGSSQYSITSHFFNTTANHHHVASTSEPVYGLAAGTYDFDVFWWTNTGFLTMDANDTMTLTVQETR